MKKISISILLALLVIAFTVTSCLCPAVKPVEKQKAPKKPAVVEPTIEPRLDGCDVCSLIRVKASAPREAIIGQEYASDVDITGLQNAGEVQLMTRIPDNLQYVRSEPPAQVMGNKLIWDLRSINQGETKKVKVWVISKQEGKVWLCFTAFALPRYCVDTNIGSAKLAISKKGPAVAQLNGTVTYEVVVTNTGTATATGVTINDQLPAALQAMGPVTMQVGDLPAGQSKTFTVSAKATQRGNHCNVAIANSTNAGTTQAQACTQVVLNDLDPNLVCPQNGLVGQPGNVTFGVRNTGDSPLTNVTATIQFPAGVNVVSSSCTAGQTGPQQVWRIGNLAAGASVDCNIVIVGNVEGRHCIRVNITSNEGINKTAECCTEWKGTCKLQITKTAPAVAQVGETFNYNIEIKNVGTGIARDVVLVDKLPPQVQHPRGAEIRETVGDLAPGQSRTFTYQVKAIDVGTALNKAVATTPSTPEPAEAQATTVIQRIGADLVVKCPEMRFANQLSRVEIVLVNTGGVALSNINIIARWSPQLEIRSHEGDPQITGQQAVWMVQTLAPGQQKIVVLNVVCKTPGRECIEVIAQSAQITKNAQCCTMWKGQPALLLEVIDTEDPIAPGQDTTYVIEVTNQGTADDQDIKIVANFPAEIKPIQIGPDIPGSIQGNRVVFQTYPVLPPKKKVKFSVRAQGVTVGDGRLKVELTSQLLQRAVNEEESTHVY